MLWIARARFRRRAASASPTRRRSRAVGSTRRSVLPSARAGRRPRAPSPSRTRSEARVSASSEARISSSGTSGSVRPIGMRRPSPSGPAAGSARVQLGHHVAQPGPRPQQDARVRVDREVGGVDAQRHDRPAALEAHGRDLPHLHPGHVHRLALAGRDRLRAGQLGLDLHRVLPHDRHPAGQREALVGQDHGAHDGRDGDQRHDGQDVGEVRADGPHGAAPEAGPPRARGGAVEGGRRLVGARRVGAVRRPPARQARARAQAGDGQRAELRRAAEARLPEADHVVAAARLEAHVLAVAVEVLPLAGQPDEAVEQLLVVLLPGDELVADHLLAGGEHDVARAAGGAVGEREQARATPA